MAAQIALAMAVAGSSIAVLTVVMTAHDESVRAKERNAVAAAPRGFGFELAPVTGTVLLVADAAAVAAHPGPVVEVSADGSLALRRAPAPGAGSGVSTSAAIVLPAHSLAAMGPEARAAVVALVGRLVDVRPVPPGRVRAEGLDADGGAVTALLQWVP
ncbi:MAG: hypothetical protein JNK78_05155 [Planctomycetes bacterium]|nr:hypothetical protein [Planctomycetota bacterium]